MNFDDLCGYQTMSILFDQIIFGPVNSRRFGVSLGINLLPVTYKYCTFDCVYCECGWTRNKEHRQGRLFSFGQIAEALEMTCIELRNKQVVPDNLTFAGNGEPTLHPSFPAILEMAMEKRDRYFPEARITVLSNATRLHIKAVREALLKADHNVLKLDCGTERMFRLINRPLPKITLQMIVEQLTRFEGHLIIQSMFVRGTLDGEPIDNTEEAEMNAWLVHIRKIAPEKVMVYSIDRFPPAASIRKIPAVELEAIAEKVINAGIPAEVF
jgi:wyosine [tRNA(Phe)-imidazoG37] synthetase (radical SAM superfamily)